MNNTIEATPSFMLKILGVSIIAISLLYTTQFVLDDDQFTFVSVSSYTVIPGILVVVSVYVAAKEWKNNTSNKIAMVFFAIGTMCWFVAEQIWQILDIVFEQDPFPSLADVFYLLAYPFFIAFLILYLKSIKKSITKHVILFSVAVSIVFLIPALRVLVEYPEGSSLDIFVGVLYPILSSILLFFTILGISFFFKRTNPYFWIMIFIGFLINAVSDTLFLFTVIDDSYYDGHITDLLYLIGYLFYIVGLILYFRIKTNDPRSEIHAVTFETISKFAIPLIIGTMFFITSMSLLYSYSYGQEFTNDSLYLPLFAGIFIIIAIFSIIIFMINKNVDKFLRLRTREIENQKQDLEVMLEKKSGEILKSSEFSNIGVNISQILHDLRNPMTVLKVNFDIIENSDFDNPVLTKRIKSMKESIKFIEEQINDILNYVKKPTIDIAESSMLEILEKAIHNIDLPKTISVHLPTKDVKILCDPVRMTLVFINLLTNAIDAMDKKGSISVNLKQNKNKIIIEFENSGPAIPPDVMEKIFEPLFTTKSNGTGLGLPTCKKIVQQHNGTISVKNNPVTFTIELPQ